MQKSVDDLAQTATWICSVCGYQHVGPEPPKKCPQCGVDDIYFDKVETGALNRSSSK